MALSDDPETNGQQTVRIGPALPGTFLHAVLDTLEFDQDGYRSRAHSFDKEWGKFRCQYVEGPKDGQQFDASLAQMEQSIGALITFIEDHNAGEEPSSYSLQFAKNQRRAMVAFLLIFGIAAVGIRCAKGPQNNPANPNPAAVERGEEKPGEKKAP